MEVHRRTRAIALRVAIVGAVACAASALATSCIARGNGQLVRQTEDDGGNVGFQVPDGSGGSDAVTELPPTDPHAVLGVEPTHGPFTGGQTAVVRGNGFTGGIRVWFGEQEVAPSDVQPIDPARVQVLVPPGPAGPVDVTTQNGDDESTRRSLVGGYVYDAFYAEPASGPTSGGTVITLYGQGTSWDAQTEVLIDLEPCEVLGVASPEQLSCATPPGTQGSKPVRVTTSDGVSSDVLDAFVYGDSDNGFRGGLSGNTLDDELTVLVLDDITGAPVPGAWVVAGDDATGDVLQTDASGLAVFRDPALGPKRSVTVAKKCFQPITFVDVPVDRVTAYLDPVLSPKCAEDGDPPPTGGSPRSGSIIRGQVVFPGAEEFKRAEFTGVPLPKADDEQRVAYVFIAGSDPTRPFRLPSSSDAVTPQASGTVGYEFGMATSAGNRTLYALAGIENRAQNPPTFVAYAMGIVRGVQTLPGETTTDIIIPVDVPIDQALTMNVQGPQPTLKGPDRVRATVAVRLGNDGYALLPVGQREALLPLSAPFQFVGLPPLIGSLAGSQYISSATASTGVSGSNPRSVVGVRASTSTSVPLLIDDFVEIPALDVPGTNGQWDGRTLQVSWAPGGRSVDLTVFEVQSAGGLMDWVVAAPAGVQSVTLPNLSQLDPEADLVSGAITINVSAAAIDAFDYGSLRYRELGSSGWSAYATDVFYATY